MKTKVQRVATGRVCLGDVFRNVEFLEYAIEKNGHIEISKIVFPYVIVLTQDCDLSQDYTVRWSRRSTSTQDKKIISVIVAPLYNAEYVFKGEHLQELGMKMQEINKTKSPGEKVRNNENQRYHYFDFPDNVPLVPLIADFKHYFTV